MRTHLSTLVQQVQEKFNLISNSKVNWNGEKMEDTSMYEGSAGVLYGMHKYNLLLRKETDGI